MKEEDNEWENTDTETRWELVWDDKYSTEEIVINIKKVLREEE